MIGNDSFISPRANIDPSSFIGSNVRVFGATTIGPGCYIDDNVVLGYPTKERLAEMIRGMKVASTLAELDTSVDAETNVGARCCIRYGSVVGAASKIADDVYCDIRTQIGTHCRIGRRTQLLYGARIYNDVEIGADCRIGGFCCNRSVIEDGVSMFGDLVHAYRRPVGGLTEASPVIRARATVGWHAIIIGDTTVGEGSYIGAGTVVARSVAADHVAVGAMPPVPRSEWRGQLSSGDFLASERTHENDDG